MRLTSSWIIAVGGVFAATAAIAATQVNVTDPTATTRSANVELGNRLAVQQVAPATFFHGGKFVSSGACTTIATPPSGKALVIRQVRIDSPPGSLAGTTAAIYDDAACTEQVGDVFFPTAGGLSTVTFDPGLAIKNGSALSVSVGTPATAYADGFKVASSVVPAAGGQIIETSGASRQRQ